MRALQQTAGLTGPPQPPRLDRAPPALAAPPLRNPSQGLRLPRLETLRAARNRLSALGDACGCAALEELDLSSNPLTTLAGIRGCRSLESLSLSDCGLVDGTLESLGRLPALTELLLADNSLTSAALPRVTKASTRLVVLDLSNNALEEDEEAAAADAEAEAAAAGARVDAAAARAAARSGPAASLLPALAPLSLLAELAVRGNPCSAGWADGLPEPSVAGSRAPPGGARLPVWVAELSSALPSLCLVDGVSVPRRERHQHSGGSAQLRAAGDRPAAGGRGGGGGEGTQADDAAGSGAGGGGTGRPGEDDDDDDEDGGAGSGLAGLMRAVESAEAAGEDAVSAVRAMVAAQIRRSGAASSLPAPPAAATTQPLPRSDLAPSAGKALRPMEDFATLQARADGFMASLASVRARMHATLDEGRRGIASRAGGSGGGGLEAGPPLQGAPSVSATPGDAAASSGSPAGQGSGFAEGGFAEGGFAEGGAADGTPADAPLSAAGGRAAPDRAPGGAPAPAAPSRGGGAGSLLAMLRGGEERVEDAVAAAQERARIAVARAMSLTGALDDEDGPHIRGGSARAQSSPGHQPLERSLGSQQLAATHGGRGPDTVLGASNQTASRVRPTSPAYLRSADAAAGASGGAAWAGPSVPGTARNRYLEVAHGVSRAQAASLAARARPRTAQAADGGTAGQPASTFGLLGSAVSGRLASAGAPARPRTAGGGGRSRLSSALQYSRGGSSAPPSNGDDSDGGDGGGGGGIAAGHGRQAAGDDPLADGPGWGTRRPGTPPRGARSNPILRPRVGRPSTAGLERARERARAKAAREAAAAQEAADAGAGPFVDASASGTGTGDLAAPCSPLRPSPPRGAPSPGEQSAEASALPTRAPASPMGTSSRALLPGSGRAALSASSRRGAGQAALQGTPPSSAAGHARGAGAAKRSAAHGGTPGSAAARVRLSAGGRGAPAGRSGARSTTSRASQDAGGGGGGGGGAGGGLFSWTRMTQANARGGVGAAAPSSAAEVPRLTLSDARAVSGATAAPDSARSRASVDSKLRPRSARRPSQAGSAEPGSLRRGAPAVGAAGRTSSIVLPAHRIASRAAQRRDKGLSSFRKPKTRSDD